MEEHVWSLKHAQLRHRNVMVILLEWNQFSTKVREQIEANRQEFGHVMAYKGVLVAPYPDRMIDALAEVLSKDWRDDIKARLQSEQFPFLLIINRDFEAFDPKEDKFAFVWFSDLKGNEENIWLVLDAIARKVERQEDVFGYLAVVSDEARQGKFLDQLAGLSKYVDMKIPILPGVISINAAAIWASLVSGGGNRV